MTVFLAAVLIFVSASCGKQASGNKLKNIERPDAAATTDEAERATSPEGAVEHSSNVNGARFGMSLGEFTEKYNYAIEKGEGKTRLFFANWRKSSDTETDNNGVAIQYWYYDDTDVSFTATVEVKTDRLLNIGVGTTMSRFMGTTGDQNNSDLILAKAALMAKTVCRFPQGSESMLQDIFYRTTTESDTLWYDGYVFNLSTKEDRNDSKNNVMLFRVFPVTDELKEEWKLTEYL